MKHVFAALLLLLSVPSVFAEKPKTRFAWGADAGASIDMTGNDMSAVDLSASFGLSRGWIKFLGAGAEAAIMVSNSCRSYPLFIDFQTDFRNGPSLVFWDLRAGLSLNYNNDDSHNNGFYGSTGLGINLARSPKFCSHILIGYTFRGNNYTPESVGSAGCKDLHCATVRIGVVF